MKTKKRVKKEKYVKICPKCKAADVRFDKTDPLVPAMGMPARYYCGQCKFTSNFFPEVKLSELEEFNEEVDAKHARDTTKKDSPDIDITYGKIIVTIWWKIMGPLGIFLGIVFFLRMDWYIGILCVVAGALASYFSYVKKQSLA